MRGLQNDKLGSTGQTLLHDVTLENNTAGFGGAIACDNCRMLVSNSSLLRNTAVRRDLQGSKQQQQHGNTAAGAEALTSAASTGSSSSSSEGNATVPLITNSCRGDDIQAAPAALMSHQVRGAGGAIAANMAGNSFLVLCGSSNNSSSNLLLHNHAQAVGGAFYVNYTASADCSGPSLEELHNLTCLAGIPVGRSAAAAGFSRIGCGLTTVNVDWSNSTSDAGGDLLGWAGGDGFSMICSSSKSSSCSSQSGNSSSLITISDVANGAGSSSSSTADVCLVKYTARDTAACLPNGAAAGHHDASTQHTLGNAAATASNRMHTRSPDLRFELPTSLGVFNGTCLRQQQRQAKEGQAANESSCAVAGLRGATMPKVFAGGELVLMHAV
jgi:predicted outer membrane repeat protein